MTVVYVLDDGSDKALYLQNYVAWEGLQYKRFKVGNRDKLETWFKDIYPKDEIKVFLHFSHEDLSKNNEKLRQEIQGLESKGWRNLIVLPFEGMTDKSIYNKVIEHAIKRKEEQDEVMEDTVLDRQYDTTVESLAKGNKYTKTFKIKEVEKEDKNDTKERTERKVSDVQKEE